MSRFLYQHKQAHRSSQTKEKEHPENLESSFKADIDLQNTVSECKREYFIWWTMQFLLTLIPLTNLLPFLSFPSCSLSFFLFFLTFFFCVPFFFFHFGKTTLHRKHWQQSQCLILCTRTWQSRFTSAAQEMCYPTLHRIRSTYTPGFFFEFLDVSKALLLLLFFLLDHLINHFYTRAGLCKVEVK